MVFGVATGLVLLVTAGGVPWVEIIFPLWVFVLSVHILVTSFRSPPAPGAVRGSGARESVSLRGLDGDDHDRPGHDRHADLALIRTNEGRRASGRLIGADEPVGLTHRRWTPPGPGAGGRWGARVIT